MNRSTAIVSTQLLECAAQGKAEEIRRLLGAGANPNFRDILDGSTGLHHAAASGHKIALQLLLDAGADPNTATQSTSATPLGIAASTGHKELVCMPAAPRRNGVTAVRSVWLAASTPSWLSISV